MILQVSADAWQIQHHRDALLAQPSKLRSPLVMRCIDDYLAGVRHELAALNYLTAQPVAATG